MKKPDFFILGAPKCGTTALSEYLRLHPQICMSVPKEPHYFADDLPGYKGDRTLHQYLDLFTDDRAGFFGEASVYYLYSDVAVENIFQYNPDARLIVMLRNPVQMIYSLHSQLLYSRNEDINDFTMAWEAQEKRRLGKRIPRYCTDHRTLLYAEVGKLGQQVQRLFTSSFPREQIKIIFFEDFIKDTSDVYTSCLSFLGAEYDQRQDFPVVNPNARHKVSWLGALYINTPPWFSNFVQVCKKVTGVKEFNISRKIAVLNTAKVKRPPLSPEMKDVMQQAFTDDIHLLSELTKRNLDSWLM